jgi:glucosamine--fructose-6-phosphate aminotransferase (isomerizing)
MSIARCSKCVLPSTLQGSDFNEAGECYWCQTNYPVYEPKGETALREFLEENRSRGDSADCMVGISGGKDSSYVLMELQETYGMKVEGFTYAHDGSTPLSLENAKKVCSNLGVRHHVVSLPNQEHLKSFQTFFKSWVHNPTNVPAAMTCVACKHLHILGTELAVKRDIPMMLWSNCPLENPPFIALKPESTREKQYERQGMGKSIALLINEMIRDRQFAKGVMKHLSTCFYGCLAVTPTAKYLKIRYPSKKQVFFFEYIRWNPTQIIEALVEKAGWVPPENIPDDWHSDCYFNVFKEYMFQKMLGVSYTDAFLSNQIRKGIITREDAWDKLLKSKVYYSSVLTDTLEIVGLNELSGKMDPACFNI